MNLAAMFLDGIEVAQKSVIVALGVTTEGTKVPLGLWLGRSAALASRIEEPD